VERPGHLPPRRAGRRGAPAPSSGGRAGVARRAPACSAAGGGLQRLLGRHCCTPGGTRAAAESCGAGSGGEDRSRWCTCGEQRARSASPARSASSLHRRCSDVGATSRVVMDDASALREVIDRGVGGGDLSVADRVGGPTIIEHEYVAPEPACGTEMRAQIEVARGEMVDLTLTAEDMGVDGDEVWARSAGQGRDPRTGQELTITVLDLCRFEKDGSSSTRGCPISALLHQLGARPPRRPSGRSPGVSRCPRAPRGRRGSRRRRRRAWWGRCRGPGRAPPEWTGAGWRAPGSGRCWRR
jgi:hypothetical protein